MITRPPPPSGRPPVYAVAGRAFGRTNLRPIIIGFTIAALIWSLVWTGSAFKDIGSDKDNEMKPLITFDIIIGSLYAAIAGVMLLGLVSAITQRTSLARLFVGLSLAVVAIVGAAEVFRTIGHFKYKGPIIFQCEQASLFNSSLDSSSFWGGSSGDPLTQDEAANFCNNLYDRASAATIAWLLLSMLFALFFTSVAFSFYRQLLDPNTFRAPRAPSDQVRLAALRHQQGPYGGGYMPYPGFNSTTSYAPPPGPPPGMGGYTVPPYEDGQLPGYGTQFAAKDVGDEKHMDTKGGDPFMDAQHTGLDSREQSETDLSHRV